MYTTRGEAGALIEGILKGLGSAGEKEIIVFPPAINLRHVVDLAQDTVAVGAQNMYFEENGAFTGETSPLMVKDSGARYVLIGHSERRHVFGETDEMVNKKVRAAYLHSLGPVVCVGELLEERESGQSEAVVKRQIAEGLSGISGEQMKTMIIAYEPVWAIGTGKVATPEIAESMHRFIRGVLVEMYGDSTAQSVPLLYGGSVKPDNIAGLYAVEDIDGVLVGGASLKADSFLDIIHGA